MSTDSSDPIKKKLVQGVATEFLFAYNWATDSRFIVVRLGEPPEPDLICRDKISGEQIRIEATTAYYDNKHARRVWEPARGKQSDPYYLTRPDFEENVRVLAHVARLIKQKAKKQYEAPGRLLLAVFTYPERLYLCDSDVEERLRALRIPTSHPFNEILILSQHGEIYQLFPEHRWVFQ